MAALCRDERRGNDAAREELSIIIHQLYGVRKAMEHEDVR